MAPAVVPRSLFPDVGGSGLAGALSLPRLLVGLRPRVATDPRRLTSDSPSSKAAMALDFSMLDFSMPHPEPFREMPGPGPGCGEAAMVVGEPARDAARDGDGDRDRAPDGDDPREFGRDPSGDAGNEPTPVGPPPGTGMALLSRRFSSVAAVPVRFDVAVLVRRPAVPAVVGDLSARAFAAASSASRRRRPARTFWKSEFVSRIHSAGMSSNPILPSNFWNRTSLSGLVPGTGRLADT